MEFSLVNLIKKRRWGEDRLTLSAGQERLGRNEISLLDAKECGIEGQFESGLEVLVLEDTKGKWEFFKCIPFIKSKGK